MEFAKLAVLATDETSPSKIWSAAKMARCKNIVLVGANQRIVDALRAQELMVECVDNLSQLSEDTFLCRFHDGLWGTAHKQTGRIRNVDHAEDSVMATKILMHNYSAKFREEFDVKPVDVRVMENF